MACGACGRSIKGSSAFGLCFGFFSFLGRHVFCGCGLGGGGCGEGWATGQRGAGVPKICSAAAATRWGGSEYDGVVSTALRLQRASAKPQSAVPPR